MTKSEYEQHIKEWLEMSRTPIENPIRMPDGDFGDVMSRTEKLLTLSESLRTISAMTRKYAMDARAVSNGLRRNYQDDIGAA